MLRHASSRIEQPTKRFGEPQTEGIIKRSFKTLKKTVASALLVGSLLIPSCSSVEPSTCDAGPFSGDFIFLREPDSYVQFQRDNHSSYQLVAENQVLVSFIQDTSDENLIQVHNWLTAQGARKVGQVPRARLLQYEFPPGTDLNQILNGLESYSFVLAATPNVQISSALDPNPRPAETVYDGYWWIREIQMEQAWDITTGSANVPVAVIDTPLSTTSGHFDGRNVRYGLRCTDESGGVSFLSQSESTSDCSAPHYVNGRDHGTEVASVLAANGNDGAEGVGVLWENPIISIDLYGDAPQANAADLTAAVVLAVEMGARIINASLVAGYDVDSEGNLIETDNRLDETTSFRLALLPAIITAYQNDVLVVLAAGNDGYKWDDRWLPEGSQNDISSFYFDHNVIVVGGVDDWGDPVCHQDWTVLDPFCSWVIRYGLRCECPYCTNPLQTTAPYTVEGDIVELSAPAYRIAVSNNDGEISIRSGTSLAAPMVTGAAALVLGEHPTYSAQEVKELLLNSASPSRGCRQIGHGILNVAAALGAASEAPEPVESIPCYDLPASTLPVVHGSNVVFSNSSGAYYLSLEDFQINEIPGDEDCRPRPETEVHIYEDTAVFRCTGNSCAGGLCYYRLGSSDIEYLDVSGTAGIDQNQIVYPMESAEGTLVFRVYNLETGDIQDYPLSYIYNSNSVLSFHNSWILTTFRYDVSGTSTWNLGAYNIETGEVRIIEEYRGYDGEDPHLSGDYIVFESYPAAYESRIYIYDLEAGSLNELASDLPFAQDPNIWENFVTFGSGQVSNMKLFLLDIPSGAYAPLFTEDHGGSIYSSMYGNVITFISYGAYTTNAGVCIIGDYGYGN